MVAALVLGTNGVIRGGSSPPLPTTNEVSEDWEKAQLSWGRERRSDVFVFGAKRRKAKTASRGRANFPSGKLCVTKSDFYN